MTTLVASKMTAGETDILDWLVHQGMFTSRSDAIRYSVRIEAQRRGLQPAEVRRAALEREQLRAPLSPALVKVRGRSKVNRGRNRQRK